VRRALASSYPREANKQIADRGLAMLPGSGEPAHVGFLLREMIEAGLGLTDVEPARQRLAQSLDARGVEIPPQIIGYAHEICGVLDPEEREKARALARQTVIDLVSARGA